MKKYKFKHPASFKGKSWEAGEVCPPKFVKYLITDLVEAGEYDEQEKEFVMTSVKKKTTKTKQ